MMHTHFIKSILLLTVMASLWGYTPKSGKSRQPNILFIMADDHAFQAISAYNPGLIKTPCIDRIAQQGMIYNRAFVTNSICAPSRAVILTGKFSHLNGVKGNSEVFDGSQPTVAFLLAENGYQTAVIGKWHLKSSPVGFGYWNVLPGQGDYYNPDFIKNGKDTTYEGYVTDIITDLTIKWLTNRKKDKPFFIMMHHKAPHRSWMPALKKLELFNEQPFPLPGNFYDSYEGRQALQRQLLTVKDHMDIRMDFKVPCETCDTVPVNRWAPGEYRRRLDRLSPAERKAWDEAYKKEKTEFLAVKNDEARFDQWKFRRYMEDYLRCIASVDESVGAVLDYLEKSGLDKNTLVIYTSDQGFFLGEHGLFDKRFMYEEALRTPLLMKYPTEIRRGAINNLMVQNIDVAPTLLDVAGVAIPKDMQGKSLRPTWKNNPTEWRNAIYYHYYEPGFGATPHYGIRTDRYKLIHFYDVVDAWELYDLEKDPTEMKNLINEEKYSGLVKNLKQELSALKKTYKDDTAK